MKKGEFVFVFILGILVLSFGFAYFQISGNVAQDSKKFQISNVDSEEHLVGLSVSEHECMKNCASIGCESGDMNCMRANSDKCMSECNVVKPESKDRETSCMEECVSLGCEEFDFSCQNLNKEKCEEECNMIKEPEARNEEEKCIRDCVKKVDPNLICGSSENGETGNEVCQRCAQECVYLYDGPFLDDKELKKKQKACETCKHCYGEPLMGDSGEGWECIVDVVCKDATNEFGDEPGEGPSVVEKVGDAIGGFFKKLFGGNKNSEENSENEDLNNEKNSEISEENNVDNSEVQEN